MRRSKMEQNYVEVSGVKMCNAVDLLRIEAAQEPDHGMVIDWGKGNEQNRYTYYEMEKLVKKIASNMSYLELNEHRILLMLPHNSKMIAYIFSCFYADAVAVPEFENGSDTSPEIIAAKIKNSKADVVISNYLLEDEFIDQIYEYLEIETEILFFTTDDFEGQIRKEHFEKAPEKSGSDLALIQFTSGTSNNPKAVLLSHENVLEGINKITQRVIVTRDNVLLGVLPLTHNLGLMCAMSMFARQSEVLFFNIREVLANPYQWLELASRYRVSVWGGINILFLLSVKYVPEEVIKNLDLSSVEVTFIGGEEVNIDLLNAFAEKFAVTGFNEKSFIPGYGMTENTLLISGTQYMTGIKELYVNTERLKRGEVEEVPSNHPNAKRYVSNGCIFDSDKILVVDDETNKEYPDGEHVGEIWISSRSVALGYMGNEEAQKERFGWKRENYDDLFLRTGDIGFVRDRHLYLTGRISDIVIVDGNNFYAADLETTVTKNVREVNAGSCAVFSYVDENSKETICLTIGYKQDEMPDKEMLKNIIHKVNVVVIEKLGIKFDEFVITDEKEILKTAIGKVKRNAIKKNYCDNVLQYVYLWKDGHFVE